jgi:tetratricopeptide (TPR) repeat protein
MSLSPIASSAGTKAPAVSVVVVVYNMAREAPRTLHSLSAAYQRNIAAEDYEVIVVDNGSTPPFDPTIVESMAGNFRLIRIDPAPPSPAHAINRGLAEARGRFIGVMIDGARIVTPGLLHFARHGAELYRVPVVASLGWYLGFDHQRWAKDTGYNAEREDGLLASIDWPTNGYRLFEIAAFDAAAILGPFAPISETNALFLTRQTWETLGGADERFDAPGGGLLNLDMFRRALELPEAELVVLLGEGTFHQLHGGVATNAAYEEFLVAIDKWAGQYESIRGHRWVYPRVRNRTFVGVLPRPALVHYLRSAIDPARPSPEGPPLGESFDQSLWSLAPAPRPQSATISALTELAESEFRARRFEAAVAVARLARSRAPDEPAPQRLLAQASAWLAADKPADDRRAAFHFALGEAYRLLGETENASSEYQTALAFNGDLSEARVGLSLLRMPGPDFRAWLRRFHTALQPNTYLEIGVAAGRSLSLASPPTCAIGVDPQLKVDCNFQTETHLFSETSDEFFARGGLAPLLHGRPLSLAFIDGGHLFEQALSDFINIERHCGPRSVILMHDTVPLDELMQKRERLIGFHSGDVWKTVPCLRHYRPELDIFTIAAPWTGLTVITGLDAGSPVLAENFDDAIVQFTDMPYSAVEHRLHAAFNIVANDWDTVEARLKARGILPARQSIRATSGAQLKVAE